MAKQPLKNKICPVCHFFSLVTQKKIVKVFANDKLCFRKTQIPTPVKLITVTPGLRSADYTGHLNAWWNAQMLIVLLAYCR
jgi:hypothetical protein